jgi:hypothetical protein
MCLQAKLGENEFLQAIPVLCLTFPYNPDRPPQFAECTLIPLVSLHIRSQLFRPERLIRSRSVGQTAPRMLVPEAAMHEDHGAVLGKGDVGLAW